MAKLPLTSAMKEAAWAAWVAYPHFDTDSRLYAAVSAAIQKAVLPDGTELELQRLEQEYHIASASVLASIRNVFPERSIVAAMSASQLADAVRASGVLKGSEGAHAFEEMVRRLESSEKLNVLKE